MKFRTEIKVTDAPQNLSPERLVLLVGSCFSDNIGARMTAAGWPAIVNPCGVVYNPVSMAVLFQLALTHRALRDDIIASSLTMREGRYVSWFMGSKASGATPDECVMRVAQCVDSLEEGIEKAGAIILTFGTSDVWLLAGSDRAVGNCHKHPAVEFERCRVGVEEIFSTWQALIGAIRERNERVEVVCTVSPRRYLADGFEENSRQKAVLILACEKLCNGKYWPDPSLVPHYFPAYEILNDDLRDYRFYGKDLLHPSEMAVDYVWEQFFHAYLDEGALERLRAMEKDARRNNHMLK